MAFYSKHIFFCTNQKTDGNKKSCQNHNAINMCIYAKKKLLELKLPTGEQGIRISKAGCLGRCDAGPNIVIYPDNVWYTYSSKEDIDKILKNHLIDSKIVEELLTTPSEQHSKQ